MMRLALSLVSLALLASCKQQPPEPAPTPTPTVAMPRTLVAADFDTLELGARMEGVLGNEARTVLSAGNHELGTMVSFVACPKGTTQCLPAGMPEGNVYTFVNRITLAEDVERDSAAHPALAPSGLPEETGATLFRTTRPLPGFNHSVGYSRSEAEAALGSADAITVTLDDGQLIWRVTKGQGWKPETTITFWWTSTKPPRTLEKAFVVEIAGEAATVNAPFPVADKPVEGGAGS